LNLCPFCRVFCSTFGLISALRPFSCFSPEDEFSRRSSVFKSPSAPAFSPCSSRCRFRQGWWPMSSLLPFFLAPPDGLLRGAFLAARSATTSVGGPGCSTARALLRSLSRISLFPSFYGSALLCSVISIPCTMNDSRCPCLPSCIFPNPSLTWQFRGGLERIVRRPLFRLICANVFSRAYAFDFLFFCSIIIIALLASRSPGPRSVTSNAPTLLDGLPFYRPFLFSFVFFPRPLCM